MKKSIFMVSSTKKNNIFLLLFYFLLVCFFSFFLETSIQKLSFFLFSLFLGVIFLKASEKRRSFTIERNVFFWCFFFIILFIILISRLIPFLKNEVFLGYDTGLYRKHIEVFLSYLPSIPPSNLHPSILLSKETWGAFVLFDILYLIGLNISQILFLFFFLLNLFFGLGIYLVTKRFFNKKAALFSFFLFAISITQFKTYWFLYYKQILATFLLLTALWLLKKKSYLAVFVGGFIGIVHPIPFFVFGLILFFHFLFNKEKKYHFIVGVLILLISLPFYFLFIPQVFFVILKKLNPIGKAIVYGGRFFDFKDYIRASIFYFPFALLGFIYLIKKRRFNYFFFWFLLSFLIIYFGIIFHNRFIPIFDIVAIILGGVGINEILKRIPKDYYLWARIGIFFLFSAMIFFLFQNVINTQPLITKKELSEIQKIDKITEKDSFVVSSISHYSPWLYGYTHRKIIAPGMLWYSGKLKRKDWYLFWSTDEPEIRHKFLDKYKGPVYIFVGERDVFNLKEKFETDPSIEKVGEMLYKYIK